MEAPVAAKIKADDLHLFVKKVFEHSGLSTEQATDAADVLLYASRRGVDTHGIRNLKPIYIDGFDSDHLKPYTDYKIEYETPLTARVDGGHSLGLSAACWAMRLAIQKAKASGIGMVVMRNSHHFGAAGYYPYMALQHDMIGVGMTARVYAREHDYGVLPTFGGKSMFSTNPLSISFPTLEEPPWLLDMSTSTVPFNRILMMRDAGQQIPLGWGVDADGQPTTDPNQVRFLSPLGGTRDQGSHKGYGLAMMVSVLCNLLAGGWDDLYGSDPTAFDGYKVDGDSHFFAALRVDLFRPLDEFKRGMDAMIRALHAAPKGPGHDRIYVAGEIEHETEQMRLREGVPLTPVVLDELHELSARYNVPLKLL